MVLDSFLDSSTLKRNRIFSVLRLGVPCYIMQLYFNQDQALHREVIEKLMRVGVPLEVVNQWANSPDLPGGLPKV